MTNYGDAEETPVERAGRHYQTVQEYLSLLGLPEKDRGGKLTAYARVQILAEAPGFYEFLEQALAHYAEMNDLYAGLASEYDQRTAR